ncbi:MAG: 2-oxoglutarate dehydrogenase complex dihydrolipoyllysine-residue succinyltransferase [Flavobacteriales bacterium]|nr:2-oxoglutarate dehydrogenase complex dihydrolipoyllysine-residue succinyltransferase [Flavobacteriales bacterium]MCX7767699.1 2-oxoglutarate dehydrogenase complex dihydrolipoyllysine-residue succinyltransferase [Flavobacteriales bacterium]MDW8409407.1 2-oxoglutarate dehydrogenase complex dihydrolipoyllysine-residue succinyltransferase [Flavobacteriales bacterium]
MSVLEVTVPSPGESVSEVEIASWLKKDGDLVRKDEEICEIDSDKATLAISAGASGRLQILVEAGRRVAVGEVIARIDTSVNEETDNQTGSTYVDGLKTSSIPVGNEKSEPAQIPQPTEAKSSSTEAGSYSSVASPAASKLMAEHGLSSAQVMGTGRQGRITKQDVLAYLAKGFKEQAASSIPTSPFSGQRLEERKKLSTLRRKISERLVSVKNHTAMLTTFNEVDMTAILEIRKKYGESFKEKFGVSLGFMGFFTRAVTEALALFPAVNSSIDGEEQVFYHYCDIGIAVSTPKGLMVPVIRNAETLTIAEIERQIKELAAKAREGRISVDEMTGGTFTITNGGVFGSLMSTPILNPPQSGILGMHKVQERPVAIQGRVEIRPMMYLAFSYDHRVIDGRESVGFLVKVKEMIENPIKLLFGGREPEEVLLGL